MKVHLRKETTLRNKIFAQFDEVLIRFTKE